MRKYGIRYLTRVKEDVKSLDIQTKKRIKKAIEKKLTSEPLIYGERLKGSLRDLWKLRVGNYRADPFTSVVYQLTILYLILFIGIFSGYIMLNLSYRYILAKAIML